MSIETIGRVLYAKRRHKKRVRVAQRSQKRYTTSTRAKRRSARKRIRIASVRSNRRSRRTVTVRRTSRSIDTYFMRLSESSA